MKSRLNKLLELAGYDAISQRQGLRPKGMGVNDFRWAVALRRADHSGDVRWLSKLLRSDRSMPGELEMSPMARELLAELLERWRVKKSDARATTLFSPLTAKKQFKLPKVKDRLNAAADEVRRLRFGQSAPLEGVFTDMDALMTNKQAIAQVMQRWGTEWDLDTAKLTAFVEGRIPFGHRPGRTPFSRRKSRRKT